MNDQDAKVTQATKVYDNPTKKPGSKSKPKLKLKFKFKKRHIILLSAFAIMVGMMIYLAMNFLTKSGIPVYGNRCDGIVEINESAVSEAINTFKAEKDQVSEVTYTFACKELELSITTNEGVSSDDSMNLAYDLLERIDRANGGEFTEGRRFSNTFFEIEGRAQYDVLFYIYGGLDTPIFGSKHYYNDSIAFTLNRPRDEGYANQLREEADRIAAEKEAEKNKPAEEPDNTGNEEETTKGND